MKTQKLSARGGSPARGWSASGRALGGKKLILCLALVVIMSVCVWSEAVFAYNDLTGRWPTVKWNGWDYSPQEIYSAQVFPKGSTPIIAADLDNNPDNGLELLMSPTPAYIFGDNLFGDGLLWPNFYDVYYSDGTLCKSFEVFESRGNSGVADVDGDGTLEVFGANVVWDYIFGWHTDPSQGDLYNQVDGWPIPCSFSAWPWGLMSAPGFADIYDNGQNPTTGLPYLEIIFVHMYYHDPYPSQTVEMLAYTYDGQLVPGFPVEEYEVSPYPPIVYDEDGDGITTDEYIWYPTGYFAYDLEGTSGLGGVDVANWLGEIHSWNKDDMVSRWPIQISGDCREPKIADLDNDGLAEVIAVVENDKLYVWNADGTEKWSYSLDQFMGGNCTPPAIADLNGDGTLELVVGSNDSDYVYASERKFSGSPDNEFYWVVEPDPDALWNRGVYVFLCDGTLAQGWPKLVSDNIYMTPTVADLDGDGTMEIIAASYVKAPDQINIWTVDLYSPINGYVRRPDGEGINGINISIQGAPVELTTSNGPGGATDPGYYETAGSMMEGTYGIYASSPPPVVADFTVDIIRGIAPLTVIFTDQSFENWGTITGYSWDFDGDSLEDSAAQNPSYTYDAIGNYTVTLTVTGPEGSNSKTKSSCIDVYELKVGLELDGSDDIVTCLSPAEAPTDDFTFLAWIKAEEEHEAEGTPRGEVPSGVSGMTGQKYVFYPDNRGAANAGTGLSLGTNGPTIYEHGDGYMPPMTALYTDRPLNTNWNHVAVKYSNISSIFYHLYVNGRVHSGGKSLGTRPSIYAPTVIGGGPYGHFKGRVADAALYDRTLTTIEIRTVKRDGPLSVPNGLVYYYDFQGIVGGQVPDLSGNGNDGTLTQ